MKVIVPKPCLVARTNGGEISMIERLRLLKSWGVEVSYHLALPSGAKSSAVATLNEYNTPLEGESYFVDGIQCHVSFSPEFHWEDMAAQIPMEKFFVDLFNKEKPDLVWSHYTDFFATTSALQWNSEKTWIDLTDNEFPRQIKLEEIPSVGKPYRSIRHTMVASPFMERSSKQSLPLAVHHLLPNIIEGLRTNPVKRSKEVWVFVNPTKVKGVDLMIDLARALPNEKFLFVGNWDLERPANLPANVAFVPRQKNLGEIFSKAKGLLMPSVWEEAFGRVPLEAMASGVPVIASDRGALPETVGGGGLCLPLELKFWIDALSRSDADLDAYVSRGFERVKEYQASTNAIYAELKKRFQ